MEQLELAEGVWSLVKPLPLAAVELIAVVID